MGGRSVALSLVLETGTLASAADDAGWSLRPMQDPKPPALKSDWVRNPIDAFILARLKANKLSPSPSADRRTLIRRANFDLLGLPPTPEQVDAFLQDKRPDVWARLIDRLLTSPRYGERWARHWMDVVHYADTHGFERDRRRLHAWPYRDYLIRAFNRDKPYDQFLREQIAGDLIRPEDPDAISAVGFLGAGPWDYVGHVETKNKKLNRKARADELDDMITTVLSTTMGLTINCARCHDHKLDPISQEEYYRLSAVFADLKRGDRTLPAAKTEAVSKAQVLRKELFAVTAALAKLEGKGLDLADVVGGGDGYGGGTLSHGIDPRSGKPSRGKTGYLRAEADTFAPSQSKFVDGIVVPGAGPTVISSTGLAVRNPHRTNGKTWDYAQFGPVHSQASAVLDGIDYNAAGHTMLGLHANKMITFDLTAIRSGHPSLKTMRFMAVAGYGGRSSGAHALFAVYLDGKPAVPPTRIDPQSGGHTINVHVPAAVQFLTLAALDGGNGISHDQVFFGDATLRSDPIPRLTEEARTQRERLSRRKSEMEHLLRSLPPEPKAGKVYAVTPVKKQVTHVLHRGDPESPRKPVSPGALQCISGLSPDFTDGDKKPRVALADWITDRRNPLTYRVIVNRVWHYHFGRGIVSTPGDFGAGGSRPTHGALLDWLAQEFARTGGSFKALHRLIMLSGTYRQQSRARKGAAAVDTDNRLLWRMNPRRLEAEAVRDAMLAVSGSLNLQRGGPGFQDFRYVDKYAPIYRYITHDRPELWRRSVYRFVVRSVRNRFMEVLDCADPSNLTPKRNVTTTALQALSLLNNPFVLDQSRRFAERARREADAGEPAQVERVYRLALGRAPSPDERAGAMALVESRGLEQLCRALFNLNEFHFVD